MKRICVVTWCYSANFGTCLQAYALYQKLRGAKYDVAMTFGIGRRNWVKDFLIRLFSKVGIVQLKDYFEAKIRHTEKQVRRLKFAQKWAFKNMNIVQFLFFFYLP